MNKTLIKAILFTLLASQAASCATYGTGYTPRFEGKYPPAERIEERRDVTFSVSFAQHTGSDYVADIGLVNRETIVREITASLRNLGIYKSIRYTNVEDGGENHLHFQFHLTGDNSDDEKAVALASAFTLFTIPVANIWYMDLAVFVLNGGEEVYSLAVSEEVKNTLWLPLIVVSPFFNGHTATKRTLHNQVNYLANGVRDSEKWQFPR